jgi:hypothetical protein
LGVTALGDPAVAGWLIAGLTHLGVQEIDLAQTARDRLLLLGAQFLFVKPGAPFLAEQVADRRSSDQATRERGMDLVLGAGALANRRSPSRDAAR